jgi:DNA topoisomerase-2
MVLFDHNGILRRYKTPEEICEEFFSVRLNMYVKRKEYMVGTLQSQSLKLDNIARFIKEKIENLIVIENKKISAVVEMLVERKYDRDPEKVWREEAKKKVKFNNSFIYFIKNLFSLLLNFLHMLFMKIQIN